jgi:tetratricopeptide (TPR) repeat protein
MTDGYGVTSIEELEMAQLQGAARWAGIRRHFDIQSFGINGWASQEAGGDVIGEHHEQESGHEELYVVLSGKATFTLDGETVDGPPGTVVFVRDPTVTRRAVADEAGTRILAVGAKRGEAFVPSTWERSAPAFGFFASGEYDKALAVLEQVAEEHPDDPTVVYNLACAESKTGRTADAIAHLRHAIELAERFREHARTDTDLDPLRDEPEFQQLLS